MVSIVVVFPRLENARNIRNLLTRSGYDVAGVCSTGAQVLQIADRLEGGIVVCGYKFQDMVYTQLRECLPPSFEMLLVASPHILAACEGSNVVGLELPIRISDLVNTLEMMTGNMLRRRKKEKAKPRQRSKEEQRIIDGAKRLLMERNHMTEEEAHRYIQKCSMDSGNTLVEAAKMIFVLMKY